MRKVSFYSKRQSKKGICSFTNKSFCAASMKHKSNFGYTDSHNYQFFKSYLVTWFRSERLFDNDDGVLVMQQTR